HALRLTTLARALLSTAVSARLRLHRLREPNALALHDHRDELALTIHFARRRAVLLAAAQAPRADLDRRATTRSPLELAHIALHDCELVTLRQLLCDERLDARIHRVLFRMRCDRHRGDDRARTQEPRTFTEHRHDRLLIADSCPKVQVPRGANLGASW